MKCPSARVGGVALLLATNKHGTLRSWQRQPSSWFRRNMNAPILPCLAPCSTLTTSRTTRLHNNAGSRDSPSIPPAKISLRNATLDDLELLQRWDEQDFLRDDNVMGDADWNDWNWGCELPRQVHWRFQLMAEVSTADETTEAIGFVQVIDPVLEETHYWGPYLDDDNRLHPSKHCRAIDIWIGEEAFWGRGYGTQIMKLVLRDYCFGIDAQVQSVLVDPMSANTAAHRFYQRLGFKPERLYNFGPDECLVHRLSREDFGV